MTQAERDQRARLVALAAEDASEMLEVVGDPDRSRRSRVLNA